MELAEYRRQFHQFQSALHQTRLIAFVAAELLQEFPDRLPSPLRESIRTEIIRFAREPSGGLLADRPEAMWSIVMVSAYYLEQVGAGITNPPKPDFRSVVYAQELVMAFAHMDDFFATSVRAMCLREPRILNRDKKISWANVLAAGNWEGVLDTMIEKYSRELGAKMLSDRAVRLRDAHGLNIAGSEDELEVIRGAEHIRHLVTHNGGRVSHEYLERTHRTDVQLGDIIPVTAHYTNKVSTLLSTFASDLFAAVASKYFAQKAPMTFPFGPGG